MIYERVKELCSVRKITIAQLEKECGFANAAIRRWSFASPTAKNLERVADYFGVSTDYLIGRNAYEVSDEALEHAKRYDALEPEKKQLADAYMNVVEVQ